MRVYNLWIVLFFLNTTSFAQSIDIKKHIAFLSSDSMNGRLIGSKEELICACYIADIFNSYNLKPLSKNGFVQPFMTKYNYNPHHSDSFIELQGHNVVAFLDNNASKTIVIGAHYDHIGKNEFNLSMISSDKSKTQVHNGADDNASGVAAVLDLARRLSSNKLIEKSNFVFVCFSGEEIGLNGSKEFLTKNKSIMKFDAMINMDMIGRMDSFHNLYIGGVGTSKNFRETIDKLKPLDFNLNIDSSGIGPSDHTSFYVDSISVLSFFTGTHEDYHKPSDDLEKINFLDLEKIIQYIEEIAIELSNRSSIEFIANGKKNQTKSSFKITLGIMPNYSNFEKGLLIDDVFEGRPAFNSGLKRGDIIIKIGNDNVDNIYDYMKCLSKLIKGSSINITIIRANKQEVRELLIPK
jgi:hypothetical protein